MPGSSRPQILKLDEPQDAAFRLHQGIFEKIAADGG
tara:strand:- start:437 stop:544 length:108 start_codon:yes stop_codon:yes gene_type:complete